MVTGWSKNNIDNFLFHISQKRVGILLVLIAVIFNAIFLWSELAISTFNLNDEVYHQLSAKEASLVLKEGLNPTDFFLSKIELGYPLFHHYQHFPQVVLATIDQLTGKFFPISRLFDFFRYLLLVLFPLSIFLAMRRFGFDYLPSGFSALVSSLLSTDGLFGFDYGSYIWRGFGLYPQLWAMFFLPLALAEIYQFIYKNNSLFWAVFLSSIVLLSNLFHGYILLLSTIIFIFIRLKKKEILIRLKRLILFFFLLFLTTSYFFLPLFPDIEYTNRSIWIPSWKYDSFGFQKVMGDLFAGRLLDYGRFPVLTILFFLSFASLLIFKHYKEEKCRLLLLLTIFWLFLFFGRPTWGALLNILPFSNFLQFHRFISGFHLGAILVVGAGMAQIFQKFWQKPTRGIVFLILILIVLSPVCIERAKFYQENKNWRIENQKAFFEAKEELLDIEKTLKNLPPGRVYAGLPDTWGNYDYYRIGSIPFYAIFPQWGIDSFGYSYHSEALSADVRLRFNDARAAEYNLFNIRYILLHKTWTPPNYYSKIKEFENYILYEVPTTGYFDLVDAPAVFYGSAPDFYSPNSKWLFSSLPELKQHPIIEIGKEPKKTFGLPVFAFQKVDEEILNNLVQPQGERREILNEKVETNKYWVQFSASRESYLILKANYHPGWQAYLDAEEVSPVMLSPGFIGIKVSPGIHEALFLYKSPFYRIPLLIFGILILFLIYFLGPQIISLLFLAVFSVKKDSA